jgi:plasmid stability protein
MKNITLKIDDATYRNARIRAAQAGTSVSAMVRDFLNREEDVEAERETKRIEAMEALFALAEQHGDSERAPVQPLSREDIYATRLR